MTQKKCCQQEENLYQRPEEQRGDLKIVRCKVCNCRQISLKVDPMRLGMKIKPLRSQQPQILAMPDDLTSSSGPTEITLSGPLKPE